MRRDIVGLCLIGCCGALAAAEIVYDNASGETALTEASAWVGGVVPGADDVVVFDGTTPETLTLGEATSWAGLIRTNIVNALTLRAPENGTLTLGAEGLRSYSENDTFYRLYLDVDLVLPVDQTWRWGQNKTIFAQRSVTGSGRIRPEVLRNASNNSFVGTVVFQGAMRAAVVPTNNVNCYITRNGSMDPAPRIQKSSKLYLVPGTETAASYAFSDLIPSHAVENGGFVSFGPGDGDKDYPGLTNTIALSASDSIRGPNTGSSRDAGIMSVYNTHVVSEGADLTGNVWFQLRNGSWTQKAGDTAFGYGAIVGRGSASDHELKEQRLSVEGGSFSSRRLVVGLGNGDTYPAEVRVSGGSYVGTIADGEKPADWWAGSIALAPKTYSGESKSDNTAFSDSEWAAGRLDISGGLVRTMGVLFGNDNNAWNKTDGHSGVRVGLSGGRLEVGIGALRTADAWRTDDSSDSSWYDVVLSGGTLAFIKSATLSPADMRLSDRNGGVSIEVPETIQDIAISGSLYGAGSLRKTGTGVLQLRGANDYTGRTDVVEGRLVYGDRFETAVWTGDSCGTLAAGAAVNPWTNVGAMDPANVWNFTPGTSIPNTSGTTAPTLAKKVLNGHDALAFNGSNTAFLTGNAAQPTGNQDSFTVALVIQTEPGFTGSASTNVYSATQFFGTSMDASWDAAKPSNRMYGLAINDQGQVGCGMFGGRWTDKATKELLSMDDENLWATNQVVNDGKPHVILWRWINREEHVLFVDDQVYRMVAVSNGVSQTYQTRIVLGVGERQQSPVKRFKGYLADLRMKAGTITDERCTAAVRELGITYGVEAFAGEKLWNAVETPVRADVPEPSAVWSADSLAQTAGQAVDTWAEQSGKGASAGSPWTFKRDLADAILKTAKRYAGSTVAPTIAADTLTGHKLVSFNGQNACLALTGGAETPVSNQDGMTVAMVVRFRDFGAGGTTFGPKEATPFFGTAFDMNKSGNETWQLMVSGAARCGVSHRYKDETTETMRSRSRFLNDGEAHVVIVRYPKKDTDDTLTLFIDGVKEDSSFKMKDVIRKTRILLGGSEYDYAHYAPVDVAEFRLWGGTVLSDAEVRTVGEELAGTYGLDLAGTTRGVAAPGQQCSKDVFVHAGASFGGLGNFGALLYPGQTLWGDGSTVGPITLTPGAAVKATTTNDFTLTDGVVFQNGAALAAEFTRDAAVRPVTVTGDVQLDGNVVVRISAPQGVRPSGTLLTWTGNLVAEAPTFSVDGAAASAVKVKLDTANKCIKVVPMGGLQIIFR